MSETVKFCPYCANENIYWNGRVSVGLNYECQKCHESFDIRNTSPQEVENDA